MNMDTNPFEAGLGFFIKLDKVGAISMSSFARRESSCLLPKSHHISYSDRTKFRIQNIQTLSVLVSLLIRLFIQDNPIS